MGHGHVIPNPDGTKARCGGPAICSVCAKELAHTVTSEPKPIRLTADEARKLAEDTTSSKPDVVAALVAHALRQIQRAATQGERQVSDPVSGLRLASLPMDRLNAYEEIKSLGYQVLTHPGDGVIVAW